jgi:hypothetical protein
MRIIGPLMAAAIVLSGGLNTAEILGMSGYDYLQKNLRLFKETSGIQKEWVSLNDEFVAIDSISKKVDWKIMNSKAEKLLQDFQVYYSHFGEDIERISKELTEEDFNKLEPFMNQAAIYVDTFDKTVIKLCKIINNLYNLTFDPESWTMKEHKKEMDAYTELSDEYSIEGEKLNNEVEKTRLITINAKSKQKAYGRL